MGYNGYTEKRKESNERYLKKFEKPTIRMTKEEKELINQASQKVDKSFNRFVLDCALEEAEKILKVNKSEEM